MATKIIDYANGELIIDGKKVKRVSEMGGGAAPQVLAAESAGSGLNYTPGFSNSQNYDIEFYPDETTTGTGVPGGGQTGDQGASGNDLGGNGGKQQAEGRNDAQISGGMINDFDNWFDAVKTGASAIPSANPFMGPAGFFGFMSNIINGKFSEANGNWNSIPGYERRVRELVDQGMSPTAAQNQAAQEQMAQGNFPDDYVVPDEVMEQVLAEEEANNGTNSDRDHWTGTGLDQNGGIQNPVGTDAPNPFGGDTTSKVPGPSTPPSTKPGTVPGEGTGGGGGGNTAPGGNNSTSSGAKARDADGEAGPPSGGGGGTGSDRGGGRAGGGNNSSSSGAKAQDRDFAAGGFVTKPRMPYQNGGYVDADYMMPKSAVPEPVPARPIVSDPRDSFASGGFVANRGYADGGAVMAEGAPMDDRFSPDPAAIASDGIVDNQEINADEGEYVVNREAAQIAGQDLLNAINDPQQAAILRQLYETAMEMTAGGGMAQDPQAVPAAPAAPASPALPPSAGATLAMFGGGPKPPAKPAPKAPFQ